jgi:hypothetical protein
MHNHFLFQPGEWLGAGHVTVSTSPELLYFRTFWSIAQQEEEDFQCTQTVEIIGSDRMVNIFSVLPNPEENVFDILLSNELLGVFDGAGVVDETLIAWEFRHQGIFEGFEVYERVAEDEYRMKAEYLASNWARTMIAGKIWKSKRSIG